MSYILTTLEFGFDKVLLFTNLWSEIESHKELPFLARLLQILSKNPSLQLLVFHPLHERVSRLV